MNSEDKPVEKLPKNFPEYSIMYKTLSKQIEKLKQQRKDAHESEAEKIELKIERYESEIKKMFLSNYFEDTD